MKGKKIVAVSTIATSLIVLMLLSSFAPLSTSLASGNLNPTSKSGIAPLQGDMTFTSGDTMYFHSTEEMEIASPNSMMVWSGITMNFTTTIKIGFIGPGDGSIDVCDWIPITWSNPPGYIPPFCSWWEVIDPATGDPLGEFHVDQASPVDFHVDSVFPGPIVVAPGGSYYAVKKIDIIEPCEYFEVHWPSHWWPEPCTWWEIVDTETGELTGYEFHVDWTNESCEFHIDEIIPEPYIPFFPWYQIQARLKVPGVVPCDYLVVEEPEDWWPEPCTWWEIIDPFTGEDTGAEFHVDWTNESCEFHIDEVFDPTGFPEYYFDFPVPFFEARQKITSIQPCDWFIIIDQSFDPAPCTWWEILDDHGGPSGLEFHIDIFDGIDMFHVDEVDPDPLDIHWLSPTLTVRKKLDRIEPCDFFRVDGGLPSFAVPCSWWKILDPVIGDVEFHIDDVAGGDVFHVDTVIGTATFAPIHEVYAERKIDDINPCDSFLRIQGLTPTVCSWWEIVSPSIWAGRIFHVDSVAGDIFHIDFIDPGTQPTPPPPWSVTAIPYVPELDWYMKDPYPDYAPVGMPDFDQRQWNTYFWNLTGIWDHCGPTAVANSIWWLDSEFEPNTIPPPTIIDNFPLVQTYGAWDDHDPLNAPWLIEHLAYLMDTDGLRTGLFHMGTDVLDMQAGITHYLSWSGVNPQGDVDGDGNVTATDEAIVLAAMGTVPGMMGWDLRADVFPVTTSWPPAADNIIDIMDLMHVQMYMGYTGQFYEHTELAPEWELIQIELEKCQDVILLLMPWYYDDQGGGWYRYDEGGHYVTVAGLNGSHAGTLGDPWEIVFSDPIRDNAEAGGAGNVPIPHAHPPPEPPYTTHNNASLVSHDMYHVIFDPCPGGPLTIIDYLGGAIPPPGPYPEWRIQIEAAVITSPYISPEEHDVAVINVTTSKTGCLPMETAGKGQNISIYVSVENQGSVTETFNAHAKINASTIGTQAVVLNAGQNVTLTFIWDTTSYAYGNYSVSATADTVPGETDTADNTFIDGTVLVTITGDIDGDRDVDIFDIVRIATRYQMTYPDPDWDPNADVIENGKIDIFDVVAAAVNYGMSW